jgi:hypothetical protein
MPSFEFRRLPHFDNTELFSSENEHANFPVVIDNRRATWGEWYAAIVRNYLKYRQYNTYAVMGIYRRMSGEGYSDDWFIDFLLQVGEAPNAKINATTLPDR